MTMPNIARIELTIDSCSECPFSDDDGDEMFCLEFCKIIPCDEEGHPDIPEWCQYSSYYSPGA